MLIRISLILAVLAALAAGALNFFVVKDKLDTLVTQRDTEKHDKETAQNELSKTKKELAGTKNELSNTQQELTDANAERDRAVATASTQTKRADGLSTKLTQTTQERDAAQNDLAAYKATEMTPDQIGKLARALKDAQTAVEASNEEKLVLGHKILSLSNELAKYIGPTQYVLLPASLKGKIVVVDPKWDFVVLDIGDNQGVLEDGELLVSREGKLVAKVIVRKVDKDRCIANVVPGWKLGEVIEGDEVTPAHPAS